MREIDYSFGVEAALVVRDNDGICDDVVDEVSPQRAGIAEEVQLNRREAELKDT